MMEQRSMGNNPIPDGLRADCENCFGLCCVALPFATSADFAFDKEGGTPCRNLQSAFRCGIHQDLRQQGFRGCVAYDCFGAGQKVSYITFQGQDWRQNPDVAHSMFTVFPIVQQLHEMLWYVSEALQSEATLAIHSQLRAAFEETDRLTQLPAVSIQQLDVPAHRATVNALLIQASEMIRAASLPKRSSSGKLGRGADLIGAQLKGADLRGANLRGALLIAADLRQADMRVSDVIGADLRDADLRGADLSECIFLTQAQLNAAKGDAMTRIPLTLTRPGHWSTNQNKRNNQSCR